MTDKILNREELKRAIDSAKTEHKKIVFTNGCFDLIHIGHVRYLREAKRLGDLLVVALNTDRSVAELKKGRPINPESQRAEVVASLEMVDFVTVFDENTPYELIRFLKPDVLVKGGDWQKEDIVGSDLVPETHSLPYVKGVSTTGILEKVAMLCER